MSKKKKKNQKKKKKEKKIKNYYKVWQTNLLQSVTEIYYKVRQVLQSMTKFITKRVTYYKKWQLLQTAAVHPCILLILS